MKTLYVPYLLPSENSVEAGSWQRTSGDDSEPLPEVVAGWAPGSSLELERAVTVDRGSLLDSAGLPDSTELELVVSWIGSRSKIRERLLSRPVSGGTDVVRVELPGERIGGKVSIRTTVVLADDVPELDGRASRAGSVLWSEESSVVLEGDSASFPTQVIDFSMTTNHPDAAWHLVTSEDVEASFGGNFVLEINDRATSLVKAIESEKPNAEQRALLNAMMSGVGEVLVEMALVLDKRGDLSGGGFDEGSIGAVLHGLLARTTLDSAALGDGATERADLRSRLQGAARELGFGGDL